MRVLVCVCVCACARAHRCMCVEGYVACPLYAQLDTTNAGMPIK